MLAALFMLGVLLAFVFIFFPHIDLDVTRVFYDSAEGFFLTDAMWVQFFYQGVPVFTRTVVVLLALAALGKFLQPRVRWVHGDKKLPSYAVLLFLFLTLVLGPGLVVHQGLKDNIGRARPKNIELFGGDSVYTSAWEVSGAGQKSFVSGHAAMGFYVAAPALLLTGAWMWGMYAFSILLGLLIGVARIAQGGHFLSDVVFSGIVVLTVIHVLYALMHARLTKRLE